MLIVIPKRVRGCSTLHFLLIDFWRVILSKRNLGFVK